MAADLRCWVNVGRIKSVKTTQLLEHESKSTQKRCQRHQDDWEAILRFFIFNSFVFLLRSSRVVGFDLFVVVTFVSVPWMVSCRPMAYSTVVWHGVRLQQSQQCLQKAGCGSARMTTFSFLLSSLLSISCKRMNAAFRSTSFGVSKLILTIWLDKYGWISLDVDLDTYVAIFIAPLHTRVLIFFARQRLRQSIITKSLCVSTHE